MVNEVSDDCESGCSVVLYLFFVLDLWREGKKDILVLRVVVHRTVSQCIDERGRGRRRPAMNREQYLCCSGFCCPVRCGTAIIKERLVVLEVAAETKMAVGSAI